MDAFIAVGLAALVAGVAIAVRTELGRRNASVVPGRLA